MTNCHHCNRKLPRSRVHIDGKEFCLPCHRVMTDDEINNRSHALYKTMHEDMQLAVFHDPHQAPTPMQADIAWQAASWLVASLLIYTSRGDRDIEVKTMLAHIKKVAATISTIEKVTE